MECKWWHRWEYQSMHSRKKAERFCVDCGQHEIAISSYANMSLRWTSFGKVHSLWEKGILQDFYAIETLHRVERSRKRRQ